MHKGRKTCFATKTYVMIVKPRMIAVNIVFEIVTIITVTILCLVICNRFIRGHRVLLLSLILIAEWNAFLFQYNLAT